MNMITTRDGVSIFYKDWGEGRPIVFHHGWPLCAEDWDAQMLFFLGHGYRVIAHDRRGHGRSTQTSFGNDMDTYAADVAELVTALDLHDAVHIGHSTGGGEVARYVARHGQGRVAKAVLISSVPPIMVKSQSNPGGVPIEVFDGFRAQLAANRAQFYREVPIPFYGYNRPGAKPSEGVIGNWWRQGMIGGAKAQYDCIKAFSETDFNDDLARIDVPTLVMHGDDDQIVPIANSSQLSAKIIPGATLKIYPGYPHGMATTHAEQINADLLAFVQGLTGLMATDAPHTRWPALSYETLRPTVESLHLWTQIVGKIRLSQTPWLNHGWHVALYVCARGLTTSLIPHGDLGFELEFDFVAHDLVIRVTDGGERKIALVSGSVAEFYDQVLGGLTALGVPVVINLLPNELADPTPFPADNAPRVYEPAVARDLWRAFVQIDRVFKRFRTRFLGKCSPVHLFWGSFDLAVTRFSGRRAPPHPGGIPPSARRGHPEAYSHEVSSAGFWPGGGGVDEPCFYAYAYPTPAGFADAAVSPAVARFEPALGEFVLPYEAVRTALDPDEALLAFLQSAYAAAADLAGWDRAALECEEGRPRRPRIVVP